tara:strand:- start:1950 stop:2426 length:477 start_codon:yes stop_codon:yes gene_type:complete
MTAAELREKIRMIIPTVVGQRKQAAAAAVEYDEFAKFPELKKVIVDLLTYEFDNFVASIDWVAPKPTTFRINLKNDFNFYLIFTKTSWIAQVEGKKYYLLNLPEEERATEAIARILRYGAPGSADAEAEVEADASASAPESGGEEVNVDVEDDVTVEI